MNWRRGDCFISDRRSCLSPKKEEERQEKSSKKGCMTYKRTIIEKKNKKTGKRYEKEVEVENPRPFVSRNRNYEEVLGEDLYSPYSEPKETSAKSVIPEERLV